MDPSPLVIRGNESAAAGIPPLPTGLVRVTSARRVEPGGGARDGRPARTAAAADEVVRVEYADGSVLWQRADDLLRERGRPVVARDGGEAQWEIDTSAPEGAERGVTGAAIKALEFFGVDLAGATAAEIGQRFERHQLGRDPGLYRCAMDGGALVAAKSVPAGRRVLLFLHGTMSSFRGSFGALEAAEGEARTKLLAAYGEQVYAFEHRTLTESPVRNALDLVARLDAGAELDIVSHSRGGLVGELLCLAEREPGAEPPLAELFARDRSLVERLGLPALAGADAKARDAAYAADAKAVQQLLAQLDAKKIRVRRFVRVACPARGTTLASARLDRWLSVLDAATGRGLFGEMADFLLAVVKKRTDPRTLPGVEAMLPGSALTRLLQWPGLTTRADLSVIAGDTEGGGAWGTLKTLVTDWFYGTDHDLVVNTGSMSGGLKRTEGRARWLLDRGPDVNHFSYFGNADSRQWLLAGLLRADADMAGFLPFVQADTTPPPARAAKAAGPQPIVVLVPGTMGSALKLGDAEIWLSYWKLLQGGLADIGWGAKGVQPERLLDDFYGPLVRHLQAAHRVEVFPYDWRLSVRDSAAALAALLEKLLPEAQRTGQPLHLLAHSMGGLVARTMIADGGRGTKVWQAMAGLKASRLLMLGTPNRGSHEAVRWLAGANPTQAKLALLDLRHDTAGIVDIVRRFPGMAELLPFDDDRFADAAFWRDLQKRGLLESRLPLADNAVLGGARDTWQRLRGARPDPARMRYVAGCHDSTVCGWQEQPALGLWPSPRLRWQATAAGDGSVTWASGLLEGVPAWYAPDTAHDELCSNAEDPRIFRAYVELLATGATVQLPATPPAVKRGPAGEPQVFTLPEVPPVDDLPDEGAVHSLSFGGGTRRRRQAVAPAPLLRVSIRHVDLAYARHAVLVGHYTGDTIVSAEAQLDRRLGGALSQRRDLGLYPGPHGTHAVFLNADPAARPRAAVVVGLGQVGDLAAGRLRLDAADAMVAYALRESERHGGASVGLSCLLVGAGGAGLEVRESVESLLRATLDANRRLRAAHVDPPVAIDQVEFIELYEDVAIAAAHALAELADRSDIRASLQWQPRALEEGSGRRRRRHFDSDRSWDQRVEITEENGQLRFEVATSRARNEAKLATGQVALADAFVQQAVASTGNDGAVAGTLFEMLLPLEFKLAAPDQRSLVLVVDRDSARFPWELLQDRWNREGRPLAVATGMVRQFVTSEYRARPAHASEFSALVVGDPDLQRSPLFPALPGAREEARRVHEQLRRAGASVKPVIGQQPPQIMAALHEKAWRVLHLAGHGVHEWQAEEGAAPRSGMVIGPTTVLGPGDVDQMRWVPELVFVNCCHLARTDDAEQDASAFHRLAANLGAEFIQMGVRAVVAAGWAVDDAAAATFAAVFYESLLQGAPFREAVQTARERTWADHPQANTWGAYQCYGDPAWRLVSDGAGGAPAPALPFVAPAELATELDNLAEWARAQARDRRQSEAKVAEQQAQAIAKLLARVPPDLKDAWLARADVAAAMAFACLQARLEEDALQWLDRAAAGARGDCPLRVLEQRVNLKSAVEGRRLRDPATPPAQRAQARRALEDAIADLAPMTLRSPTAERLGVLGSAYKRLAWGLRGAERVAALLDAARHYAGAVDAAGGAYPWALTNWATVVLLGARLEGAPPLPAADLRRLRTLVEAQAERSAAQATNAADVWDVTPEADLALVRMLLDEGAVAELAGRAQAGYRRALGMGASPREQASMREQVLFMQDLLPRGEAALQRALAAVAAVFGD